MDNALYASPMCSTCQNNVFYETQITTCADMNYIGLLCLYLSYGINHTLSYLLHARIIALEASYGVFLNMRLSVKGYRHNFYTVASFMVVGYDIACPGSYAAADNIRSFEVWSAEKYLHNISPSNMQC